MSIPINKYNFGSERTTSQLVVVFVILFSVFLYLIYKSLNEGFMEFFGSECVDFIPFKKRPIHKTKKGTIFISIASYRDEECSLTVKGIFEKAKNPENVFLGICEQNKDNSTNEKCFPESFLRDGSVDGRKWAKNIRYHNMDYLEAKGPTFARYFCSQLWEGEEYFLQIDSHTFFEKNWDENLIKMLEQARYSPEVSEKHPYGPEGSKKPVLSVYPPTAEQLKLTGAPCMDHFKFGANKLPVFLAGFWSGKKDKPVRSAKPFIAAGLMFCDSSFLNNVPYDPNLSQLFQGEEVLFSARMFTNGFDVFAPNINVCSHHYSRPGPLYFNDIPNHSDCRSKAEKRVLFLLGIESKKGIADEFLRELHQYGLGSFRSIQDFWNASGIDFNNKDPGGSWTPSREIPDKYKDWCFNRAGYKKIKQFI